MAGRRAARGERSFAVVALDQGRWYWVVWPAPDEGMGDHMAQGVEPTKAEAVEQALNLAGSDADWLPASAARAYRRQAAGHAPKASPAVREFLYHDVQDERTGQWYSVRHRVLRKTPRYVWVEQRPDEAPRPALERNPPTFRLDRLLLEREGYAPVPPTVEAEAPFFFTAPYAERAARFGLEGLDALRVLGLAYPCTAEQVRAAYRVRARQVHPDAGGSHEAFLALHTAYEQALRLCRG